MVNGEFLPSDSPLSAILQDGIYQRLIECFDDLPPEHQDALLLTRFEGDMTVEDTAEVLEKDPQTVRNWIGDALLKIEDRMGDELAWYGRSSSMVSGDDQRIEDFLAGTSNIEAIYRVGATETCPPEVEEKILAGFRTSTWDEDEVVPLTRRLADLDRHSLIERIKGFLVIPRFNTAVLGGAVTASFAIALSLSVLLTGGMFGTTDQPPVFRGPVGADGQDSILRQPDQMLQWIRNLNEQGQTKEARALFKAFRELYPAYAAGDLEQLLAP